MLQVPLYTSHRQPSTFYIRFENEKNNKTNFKPTVIHNYQNKINCFEGGKNFKYFKNHLVKYIRSILFHNVGGDNFSEIDEEF